MTETAGPRRVFPLIALIVLAGVILGVTFNRQRSEQAPSPVPVDSPTTPSPPPARHRAAGRALNAPSGQISAQNIEASRLDMLRKKQEVEIEAARKAKAQYEAFSGRYSTEKVDAPWAAAKEVTVMDASKSDQIELLHAEPGNLDIRCKSSICRIQADFAKHSLAEDWLTLFMLGLGSEMPNLSFHYSDNPDGSTRVTIYGVSHK